MLLSPRLEASASAAALAYPDYLLRVGQRRVRAVIKSHMVLHSTSAHAFASLHYSWLQVIESIQMCYADENWPTWRLVPTTENSSLFSIIEFCV